MTEQKDNPTTVQEVRPSGVGNSLATPLAPSSNSKRLNRKSSSKTPKRLLAIAGVVAIAGASGYGGAWLQDQGVGPISYPFASTDGNSLISEDEEVTTEAVKSVSQSVVSIVTSARPANPYAIEDSGRGAGTGIIISADGYILTNKHVVDGATDIQIVTNEGKSYTDVEIVGTDPLNDVAFLKIKKASGLPVATIGDSSSTRIGQRVIAIGNSLGQYQNTVTSGIISGKGRPVMAQSGSDVESLTDLIQTDAAINPGNSGGPLINSAGQVIGINTAVATEAQGIGFAIPIDATKGMIKTVLETGEARRAYVGVNYLPITPEVASEFELTTNQGAYVYAEDDRQAVIDDSPADKAGVEAGDIITKVNGEVVGEAGGVSSLIGEYAPGETVKLTIMRDGKERNLEMKLEAYQVLSQN